MGYVRLRDFNLRATKAGHLTPIDSRLPIPLDFGYPAAPPLTSTQLNPAAVPPLISAQLYPEIPQLQPPPQPPVTQLAEGTADGLEPVVSVRPASPLRQSLPQTPPRFPRAKNDTIPEPFLGLPTLDD